MDPITPFNVPLAPFVDKFEYAGIPGLHHFYIELTSKQTIEQVKKFVLKAIAPLSGVSAPKATVEILTDHSPVGMRFSAKAVKDGIYKRLADLQGKRDTFYTGLSFAPDDSSLLWRFTDLTVLPALLASLE